MAEPEGEALENRALALTLTARDGELTRSLLRQGGIECTVCRDLNHLCEELDRGAAVVLFPEEALADARYGRLEERLAEQPSWSDLPLLVLSRGGADSPAAALALEQVGNVTLLDRPVRTAILVSAVRTAQRARERQYQIRAHLAERQRSEEALRAADRHKDEFLAMLAHELRNPVAMVMNALHILEHAPFDAERVEKLREVMERQGENLVRLLDDLLDMARVTQGKVSLNRESTDLAPIVQRALETVAPLMEGRGHDLSVLLPLERVRLHVDAVRLEQVITNLLHNAAKYTDPGGQIRLTAEVEGSLLSPSHTHASRGYPTGGGLGMPVEGSKRSDPSTLNAQPSTVAIRVRDNGMGIAAETLPQIFDLFAQAERSLDRSQGGLGIGLTLVRQLVAMHGGTIEAFSEGPGRGSEFVVRLPVLAAERAPRPRAPRKGASPAARPLRILVVEDNEDAAELMAELLRLNGHEVRAAHDGPAALAVAEDFGPQVVICDLGLPGMDGLEVARRLRQLPSMAETVLLAVTGYGHEEARAKCRAAGFDLHLTKPVDPHELHCVLAGLPDGTGARREEPPRLA